MKRRSFLGALGGAAVAWPFAARAQQSPTKRIGALVIGNADTPSFLKELNDGLRERGRIEGRDYAIDLRSAEGQLGRLPELAADLVRLKVDVIVALFTPCALAAQQATARYPDRDLVRRSARHRPGPEPFAARRQYHRSVANGRGNSCQMRGTVPRYAAVRPAGCRHRQRRRSGFCEVSARTSPARRVRHGNRDHYGDGPRPERTRSGFYSRDEEKADAVVYQASLPTKRVADLAIAHRLPTATTIRAFAEVGGLMAYGSDGPSCFGAPRHSSTRFSEARNRRTFPSSSRPNSIW